MPAVPSLDPTLSQAHAAHAKLQPLPLSRAPELSLPRAQGHQAERSRETPPYAQAEEPPGPAAAPQPRPRLSGRHSRRSRLLLRLLRGAGPGRRAPPLPRAGSAAGGPGSGPLCAAAGCECGPGREAAGSAWPLPLGERDRRPPIRPSLHPAGSGARLGPPRCPRGKRAGGGAASLFSSFSHLVSVVLPQAGPGDRPP